MQILTEICSEWPLTRKFFSETSYQIHVMLKMHVKLHVDSEVVDVTLFKQRTSKDANKAEISAVAVKYYA